MIEFIRCMRIPATTRSVKTCVSNGSIRPPEMAEVAMPHDRLVYRLHLAGTQAADRSHHALHHLVVDIGMRRSPQRSLTYTNAAAWLTRDGFLRHGAALRKHVVRRQGGRKANLHRKHRFLRHSAGPAAAVECSHIHKVRVGHIQPPLTLLISRRYPVLQTAYKFAGKPEWIKSTSATTGRDCYPSNLKMHPDLSEMSIDDAEGPGAVNHHGCVGIIPRLGAGQCSITGIFVLDNTLQQNIARQTHVRLAQAICDQQHHCQTGLVVERSASKQLSVSDFAGK